jgi:hypothetical protein
MVTGSADNARALTPPLCRARSQTVGREPATPTVRLIDGAGGLVALEVEAPIPVVLDLLDLLHAAGVHLVSFDTLKYNGWAHQRIAITERDGTAIRDKRRLQLQRTIVPLLERPVSARARR